MEKYVIGLDYGSDSARAIVVNALTGETLATAVKYYPRWKEGKYCNPAINQYRQHPQDYIDVLEASVKEALAACPAGGDRFRYNREYPCFYRCHGDSFGALAGIR